MLMFKMGLYEDIDYKKMAEKDREERKKRIEELEKKIREWKREG